MALKLVQQPVFILGHFTMTVADSVDGLAYTPDANGNLVVATAASHLGGYLVNRAKVGDKVSMIIIGACIAKASGVIAAGGPFCYDAAGKIKAATVGTDDVKGYVWPIAAAADGDIVSVVKTG